MNRRFPMVLCLLPVALGGTTSQQLSAAAPVHQALPPTQQVSEGSVAAPQAPDAPDAEAPAPNPRDVACVAKVVLHEAGNQPRRGQVAVAQVIRARMEDGRFARSACAVVKQPGQFFDVDSYHPERVDARWDTAVEVATEALKGEAEEVVPGALFFHAVGSDMPNRTRVARVAGHVFYR